MRRLPLILVAALMCVAPLAVADDTPAVTPVSSDEFEAVLSGHEGKVVLVNFWATWCAPCLREIPALMEVESTLADEEFAFVALSMDDPYTGAAMIQSFIDRHFEGFTTYLRTASELHDAAAVIDPAWNEIMPTTYILDREGNVATMIQGLKSADEFLVAVREHL